MPTRPGRIGLVCSLSVSKIDFVIITVLLLSAVAVAQQTTTDNQAKPEAEPSLGGGPQQARAEGAVITIPAGTRLPLVLTHGVNSKTMHTGDQIYAQTTAPVTVGDQLAIPSGTFVPASLK